MVALPFGTGAYQRRAGRFPPFRLVNMFAEATPANANGPVALLSRPSLQTHLDVGTGPIRGVFSQSGTFNGEILSVSGNKVYRTSTEVGTITGSENVRFATSGSQVLISTGAQLYLTDGSTVSGVAFPDGAQVSAVAFIAGYFVAVRKDSQKFYWSAVFNGASWDGLDFASAESSPDNLLDCWVIGDELWLLGANSTEVWVPSGDQDAPFVRVEGRLYDKGIFASGVAANVDNTLFWVTNEGFVARGDARPIRVSDHAIEEAISNSTELKAWAFTWQGHNFFVLLTDDGTFAFDAATREWCEFASYGFTKFRCHVGIDRDQTVIMGDDTMGRLWTFNDSAYYDGSEPIQRVLTAALPTNAPVSVDNILLDASVGQTIYLTGQGADPVAEMRVSRDAGNTWSGWRETSVGQQGEYRKRVIWRRCGAADEPGYLIEFRITDPAPWRVSGVRANEPLGGRSR